MSQKNTLENPTKSVFSFENGYLSILLFLYAMTDFLPKKPIIDIAGIQWFYLAIINFVATLLLFKTKISEESIVKKYYNLSTIPLIYAVYAGLSAVSIFAADNKMEAIWFLSKISIVLSGLIVFSFLSKKTATVFLNFSILVSILLFLQTVSALSDFYNNLNKIEIEKAMLFLNGNAENVNIFAASIILKIPFVLYGIHYFKNYKKIFFIIALFTGTLALFLISSRATLISLVSIIGFYVVLHLINKVKGNKWNAVYVVLIVAFAFFAQEKSHSTTSDRRFSNEVGTFALTNQESGFRFNLWKNTIAIASENPIIGCGLGNYKLKAIPAESKQRQVWDMSVYSHNDFLQVAAETGWLNMLVYFLIFLVGGICSLKTLISTENETEKWISIVVLSSIAAYFVDAFFNFPQHRPITQVFFVIFLFWSITISENKFLPINIKLNSKLLLAIMSVLGFATIIPSYYAYQSLKAQNIVIADESTLSYSYAVIDEMLPNFPNLNVKGQPILVSKAAYLIKEQQYKKAEKMLHLAEKDNRNGVFSEFMLADLYSKVNQKDSVLKYRKKCLDMYPMVNSFLNNYMYSLVEKKDTLAVLEQIKKIETLDFTPTLIKTSANFMANLKRPIADIKKLVRVGLKKFPNDTLMINTVKNYDNFELVNFNKKLAQLSENQWAEKLTVFLEMLKMDYNSPVYNLNVGICYFKLTKSNLAIPYLEKAVNSKKFNNGSPEFVLGICYLNTKNKSKGCELLNIAKSKNYPVPSNIFDGNCK